MRITERLNAEHGVFLEQLEHLEQLLQRQAPTLVLTAAAQTIAGALEPHLELEDEVLYPAVREALGPQFPPIQAMGQEHEQVERLVREVLAGPVDEPLVRSFIQVLRAHVENEIHMLFPIAEESIPAEKLASMANWNADHVYERAGRRP